jgi:hypothetical protein
MAETLDITAGMTAALRSLSSILSYLVNVKEPSVCRNKLIREISTTRGILSSLNETVDDARVSDEIWFYTIRALRNPDGPIYVMKAALEELSVTLQGPASKVGIKEAAMILKWPFKKGELDTTLKVIDSQKYFLALALENDHHALVPKMHWRIPTSQKELADLSRDLAATRARIESEVLTLLTIPMQPILTFLSPRSTMLSSANFLAPTGPLSMNFAENTNVIAWQAHVWNSSIRYRHGETNPWALVYSG